MTKLTNTAKKFFQGEEGATMVEYGLMLALIAVVCVTAVGLIGTTLNTKFGAVNTAINP
jgi:pilus assembly protein Flp/PilA